MGFFFAALVFMLAGRKLGWMFSKKFLYPTSGAVCLTGTVVWGVNVAFAMDLLIAWLHPGMILKWIMGFALGAYVAIPNYGLFAEPTIPEFMRTRHRVITNLALVAFVVTEIVTRTWRP